MSNVIKSGSNGNTAEVDATGRLRTFATSETQRVSAARNGQAFSVAPSIVHLTSDTESGIIYVKNTDTVDWVLSDIVTRFGKSTGGDGGDFTSHVVINPTSGTLLDVGVPTGAINLKVGDPQVLTGIFLQGFEEATSIGGFPLPASLVIKDQIEVLFSGGPIILAPSTSFSYAVTPPTGNTSMNVKLSMIIFRDTGE